jgi:hypothetical protein
MSECMATTLLTISLYLSHINNHADMFEIDLDGR